MYLYLSFNWVFWNLKVGYLQCGEDLVPRSSKDAAMAMR
jgi:hypothetical protein